MYPSLYICDARDSSIIKSQRSVTSSYCRVIKAARGESRLRSICENKARGRKRKIINAHEMANATQSVHAAGITRLGRISRIKKERHLSFILSAIFIRRACEHLHTRAFICTRVIPTARLGINQLELSFAKIIDKSIIKIH